MPKPMGIFMIALAVGTHSWAAEAPKWQAKVPAVAADPKLWQELIPTLIEKQMYYGAMAAAGRMLVYFSDIESKDLAYRTLVQQSDRGFPQSIQPAFVTGDFVPTGDPEFINSYYFYKFMINREKKLSKWADYFLANIDQKNFNKFIFFEAIEAYLGKDYGVAEEKLKLLLRSIQASTRPEDEKRAWTLRLSRTLARVYFDQAKYDKAFDIYDTFLLRTNPLRPNDWLEAAWTLYYLQRYSDAIGMLYNLESKAKDSFFSLERYVIRALSYRDLCDIQSAETLIDSFQKDFGEVIKGLKRGDPTSKFPVLYTIDAPGNAEVQHMGHSLVRLKAEQTGLGKLSSKLLGLGKYLYQSEIQMIAQKVKGYTNVALEKAAEKLVLLDENLKFIKFDVQRERFNPDLVFRPIDKPETSLVEKTANDGYRIHWIQYGDYWRDERFRYRGMVTNRCSE